MTITEIIASLPSNPSKAIEEIDTILQFDGVGCRMMPADRQLLVLKRLELMKSKGKRK